MKKEWLDGLYLMVLGCAVFLALGAALETTTTGAMIDFKMIYYSGRCLLQGLDPYQDSNVMKVYRAEGQQYAKQPIQDDPGVTRYIYLPTAYAFTVPFATLPYGPAHLLWMFLTGSGLILASFLMWDLSAAYAPVISACLIGFLIANSELPLVIGNPAGIAVSLCVVAVWCFIKQRYVPIGILCFALSLVLKPHDAGLVWLYFLLAGGVYRKRALQTLAVVVVLGLPIVLWVSHISPHWITEQHVHMASAAVRGGPDDPGPTSTGSHGVGMIISLQSLISLFWDDARVFNPVSYLVCGVLLLIWALRLVRPRSPTVSPFIPLAAIAILTLLPVYHRQSDASLLLLTIPACSMLWAKGGKTGKMALAVSAIALLITGDVTWGIFLALLGKVPMPNTELSGHILTALQMFPAPLILLIVCVFYLWVFVRRDPDEATTSGA